MPMMALVNPVYDCLFRLAQPDSLSKEEEVGGPGMKAFEVVTSWGRSLVGAVKACQLTRQAARSGIYPQQSSRNLLAQRLPSQWESQPVTGMVRALTSCG